MHAIEFQNVSFSYGPDAPPALTDVSFHIDEGEFVALVGNNGSGKSTVARLCDAFAAPTSGAACVLGHDIASIAGTDDVFALRREVGFVFQNPDDQLVASLVVDEVAFGPRNLGLPREDILARINEALAAVGMSDAIGRDVNALSGGQRQRIAIADALAMRPRLLILDEPTSMIDAEGKRDLMSVIERLHDGGMTILLITHDPSEAARAERILRMRDGRVSEVSHGHMCAGARESTPAAMQAAASAAPPAATQPAAAPPAASAPVPPTPPAAPSEPPAPLIRFENVSFTYDGATTRTFALMTPQAPATPALSNVDLAIYEGETLAVAGPNGSGKTTLIQHMNGLLKPTCGRVFVNGTDTSSKAGANAARRVVGITFQYPERSLFAETVRDEIAFGPRNLGLAEDEVDQRVRTALDALALPYELFAERNPFGLSGGEQRKVAIAAVLAMRPRVLVLDEPCAGMDIPSHDHLIGLLRQLKATRQTIVIVTHEQRDIDILADRVFRLG